MDYKRIRLKSKNILKLTKIIINNFNKVFILIVLGGLLYSSY